MARPVSWAKAWVCFGTGATHERSTHRGGAGFTLIELMISLVVAAILLTLAVPSFLEFMVSNRLNATANGMVAAIDAARMAAIKRNASAQFCSDLPARNSVVDSLDPTQKLAAGCNSVGAGPGAVYTVIGTGSADDLVRPSQVLAASSGLASLQLSGHVVALRCNSLGVCSRAGSPATPYSNNDVAVLCSSQLSHNNRYAVYMTNGSITQINKSTGDCP